MSEVEEIELPANTRERASHSIYASIDYQKLSREIVRQMRGQRTQREFSSALGFGFNQVGKWESGATHISWNDFVHIANTAAIDVEAHYRHFFWNFAGEFNAVNVTTFANTSAEQAVQQPHWSSSTVRRWLRGQATPDFADVLYLIDARRSLLLGWLERFLDCDALPELAGPAAAFRALVDLVGMNPRCVYVNAALNLKAYRDLEVHDELMLARHSACASVQELRQTLEQLQGHGLVFFDGKKYHTAGYDFSFSTTRSPKLRSMTVSATQLVAERYSRLPIGVREQREVYNPAVSSVRIVAMSEAAAQKASKLYDRLAAEIGRLVEEDKDPKTNVQIFIDHCFPTTINAPALANDN